MKDQEYDYFYDDEQDAKYCYPGTNVLKNKLDIRDLDRLHEAERDYSSVRQAELSNMGVTGDFSFKHLCSIHKQLFQDVYSWAGKTRTVDISKGTIFCLVQFIESQFDDLYRKLKKENFLADIADEKEMGKRLAFYLGELNMIHPFREGNGRTQRIFIEQMRNFTLSHASGRQGSIRRASSSIRTPQKPSTTHCQMPPMQAA